MKMAEARKEERKEKIVLLDVKIKEMLQQVSGCMVAIRVFDDNRKAAVATFPLHKFAVKRLNKRVKKVAFRKLPILPTK